MQAVPVFNFKKPGINKSSYKFYFYPFTANALLHLAIVFKCCVHCITQHVTPQNQTQNKLKND